MPTHKANQIEEFPDFAGSATTPPLDRNLTALPRISLPAAPLRDAESVQTYIKALERTADPPYLHARSRVPPAIRLSRFNFTQKHCAGFHPHSAFLCSIYRLCQKYARHAGICRLTDRFQAHAAPMAHSPSAVWKYSVRMFAANIANRMPRLHAQHRPDRLAASDIRDIAGSLGVYARHPQFGHGYACHRPPRSGHPERPIASFSLVVLHDLSTRRRTDPRCFNIIRSQNGSVRDERHLTSANKIHHQHAPAAVSGPPFAGRLRRQIGGTQNIAVRPPDKKLSAAYSKHDCQV